MRSSHRLFVAYTEGAALPFLKNTVLFLYPIAAVVVLYVRLFPLRSNCTINSSSPWLQCLSIVLNINLTVAVMNAYFLSAK